MALLKEEERLWEIYNSLRVTPDDKLRWQNIRDACMEASILLTSEVGSTLAHALLVFHPANPLTECRSGSATTLPHAPTNTTNGNKFLIHSPTLLHKTLSFFFFWLSPPQRSKAARHIRALAQTVTYARQSLLQSQQNIRNYTQKPGFSLLWLEDEYMLSERRCRQRIQEVHLFSEQFLDSVVKVPSLDGFRDHVLPSTAESSAQILRTVQQQVQSTREPPVLRSLPPATYMLTFFSIFARVRCLDCFSAASGPLLKF